MVIKLTINSGPEVFQDVYERVRYQQPYFQWINSAGHLQEIIHAEWSCYLLGFFSWVTCLTGNTSVATYLAGIGLSRIELHSDFLLNGV